MPKLKLDGGIPGIDSGSEVGLVGGAFLAQIALGYFVNAFNLPLLDRSRDLIFTVGSTAAGAAGTVWAYTRIFGKEK